MDSFQYVAEWAVAAKNTSEVRSASTLFLRSENTFTTLDHQLHVIQDDRILPSQDGA
jgi:hypothetical protein